MYPFSCRSTLLLLTFVAVSCRGLPTDTKEANSNVESAPLLEALLSDNGEKAVSKRSPRYSQRSPSNDYYEPWVPDNSQFVQRPVPFQPLVNNPQYQPQRQSINGPYYIPVWVSQEGRYVYYPPQPLPAVNNPYPIDNPPKNYPDRTYLPPNNSTAFPCGTTFNDRLNPQSPTIKPNFEGRPTFIRTTTSGPTRETPRSTTNPPLVRSTPMPQNNQRPQTPRTTRPPAQSVQSMTTKPLPKQPSPCIWAIISCCSVGSETVNSKCFSALGCDGPIWGGNPCNSEFAHSVIQEVMNNYYAK